MKDRQAYPLSPSKKPFRNGHFQDEHIKKSHAIVYTSWPSSDDISYF
jgi:hypothetical protein